ncbi:MAG: DJ-1/PfpI family protein [Vulcanimicrobiota bacterium]
MRLSIVLFDGFTTLDAVGGYEVLSRLPGLEVEFVAANPGVIAADTRQLGLLAYRQLDHLQATDILYVPGGPGVEVLLHDRPWLAQLSRLDATSTWTVGICNGVGLLAAAGLLEGQRVTTNWFYRGRLAQYGLEVVEARYCRSGKYLTGAGVSASLDAALYLVELLAGAETARTIGLGLEYYPAPPYQDRHPQDAPARAQALVAAFESQVGKELLAKQPVFQA